MNREIKFRAWDDVLLKMWNPLTIEKIAKSNFNSTNWFQLKIMEYTGLKDKNGVEIYEGDIVSYIDSDDFVKTSEIVFNKGAYCVKSKCKFRYFYTYTIIRNVVNELEVIGNIYENSELLKMEVE